MLCRRQVHHQHNSMLKRIQKAYSRQSLERLLTEGIPSYLETSIDDREDSSRTGVILWPFDRPIRGAVGVERRSELDHIVREFGGIKQRWSEVGSVGLTRIGECLDIDECAEKHSRSTYQQDSPAR